MGLANHRDRGRRCLNWVLVNLAAGDHAADSLIHAAGRAVTTVAVHWGYPLSPPPPAMTKPAVSSAASATPS